MKKYIKFCLLIFVFSLEFSLFAQNLSLLDHAKKDGMTLYWDSLSETGMLEKNGHQFSFRKDEPVAILDSYRIILTDKIILIKIICSIFRRMDLKNLFQNGK